MSGNPPPSDPYGRQQYSFSGRILLTTAVILFALTVVFVVLRILVHALQWRAGGGRARRGGGLAAGILRSISGIGSSRRGLDASALSALPVTSYRKEVVASGASGAGGADCAVCLSELADGDKVRELPNCGHAFHVECVDAWLRAKSTCPLCRADVELQQGNGKAEAQPSCSSSSSAAATEPLPQPALFGAGGTLIVTIHGGSDSRRDVRGSTSG